MVKLHNGKPAKDAGIKEINASIKWFSDTIEKYKRLNFPFVWIQDHKARLEAYRSDRIGKKK